MRDEFVARQFGVVEAVTASEISVSLDVDAPHGVALGSGIPVRFPRVNSIVILPTDDGDVVGIVHALRVVPSSFPKRSGLHDFGLVDLPFPSRRMEVTMLGILRATGYSRDGNPVLSVDRGVLTPPSLGSPVLHPTERELAAVIEGGSDGPRVEIGRAALARELRVSVDPDRLFGRHVAVLGNTGSGKSCTVAGLVRWSVEAAQAEATKPNARFVILDPNGEYRDVFSDLANVRTFRAEPDESSDQLRVPAWLWNAPEWAAFSEAARGVQRPLLFQALRNLRAGSAIPEDTTRRLAVLIHGYLGLALADLAQGPAAYAQFPGFKNVGQRLQGLAEGLDGYLERLESGAIKDAVSTLARQTTELIDSHLSREYWSVFSEPDLASLAEGLSGLQTILPTLDPIAGVSEDAPVPFDAAELVGHLEVLASGEYQASQFVGSFGLRIRTMLSHIRMRSVVGPSESDESLEKWLTDYLSSSASEQPSIVVVDLSLVPESLMHIVASVIARVMFEALQRFRRARGVELPTVLVVEEAHHFVHRNAGRDEGATEAAALCRTTLETIAREGRKFGLGLVLSSQRPSEVSPTVLSQCNTFVLHRIVNDRDQELVRRLVPDNLGRMLDDLPSLPTQHAILLGWATAVPTLVRVRSLAEAHRPHSNDPEFWSTWVGTTKRDVDWSDIADDWRSGA